MKMCLAQLRKPEPAKWKIKQKLWAAYFCKAKQWYLRHFGFEKARLVILSCGRREHGWVLFALFQSGPSVGHAVCFPIVGLRVWHPQKKRRSAVKMDFLHKFSSPEVNKLRSLIRCCSIIAVPLLEKNHSPASLLGGGGGTMPECFKSGNGFEKCDECKLLNLLEPVVFVA